jgi:hypothetical protein
VILKSLERRTNVQDWNYLHTNDFELTLELGCVKYPEHGQLAAFWQENREPLLKYLEAVHLGVKGGHQIFYFLNLRVRILRPLFQLCFSLFTRNIIMFIYFFIQYAQNMGGLLYFQKHQQQKCICGKK